MCSGKRKENLRPDRNTEQNWLFLRHLHYFLKVLQFFGPPTEKESRDVGSSFLSVPSDDFLLTSVPLFGTSYTGRP